MQEKKDIADGVIMANRFDSLTAEIKEIINTFHKGSHMFIEETGAIKTDVQELKGRVNVNEIKIKALEDKK